MPLEFQREVILKEAVEPRLISSISRTGRVYWQDDFEAYTSALTEKWAQVSGTIALDTTTPFRGKSCAKLTTGNVAGNEAKMEKFLGALPKGRFGYELWFKSVAGVANIRYLNLYFQYYDGAKKHVFAVRWIGTLTTLQQKWQYFDSTGSYVDIPNGAQKPRVESTDTVWHHVKLIGDFLGAKYVKLICNDKTFPLSTIPEYNTSDTTEPSLRLIASIVTETATAISLYIDDVIFTDQEP